MSQDCRSKLKPYFPGQRESPRFLLFQLSQALQVSSAPPAACCSFAKEDGWPSPLPNFPQMIQIFFRFRGLEHLTDSVCKGAMPQLEFSFLCQHSTYPNHLGSMSLSEPSRHLHYLTSFSTLHDVPSWAGRSTDIEHPYDCRELPQPMPLWSCHRCGHQSFSSKPTFGDSPLWLSR